MRLMIESHESKVRYQDVMWIDMALKRKKNKRNAHSVWSIQVYACVEKKMTS